MPPPNPAAAQLRGARVTILGGQGFIGARLAPALLRLGAEVTTASRSAARGGPPEIPHIRCDLATGEGVDRALEGAEVAYFLVHSMAGGDEFAARERAAAEHFNAAARRQGVRQVVYLGGLYPSAEMLSEHLESRRRVGLMLIEGSGALAVRAGVVVGAGSDSFQIIYSLARRLPAMIAPRWLSSLCQPIGAGDAIRALAAAPLVTAAREVDLAGPDVLTYRRMLEITAGELGGPSPLMVPVPVLSPELSSHWLRLVTRVDMKVARSLVSSLRHDLIAERPLLTAELGMRPLGFGPAVRLALAELTGAGSRGVVGVA